MCMREYDGRPDVAAAEAVVVGADCPPSSSSPTLVTAASDRSLSMAGPEAIVICARRGDTCVLTVALSLELYSSRPTVLGDMVGAANALRSD